MYASSGVVKHGSRNIILVIYDQNYICCTLKKYKNQFFLKNIKISGVMHKYIS